MDKIDFLNSNCCSPSKKTFEGCANGMSYIAVMCDNSDCGSAPTLTYINMSTGLGETEAPDDFVLGNCIDARATAEEVLVGDEAPAAGDLAPTGSKLFFDTTTNKITHANVDGVWVEIADSSLSFSDILASGNKILTITDSDGNETEVFESVTEVTAITDGFSYKNEAGEDKDITFEINDTDPLNTKVEVKLNGTTVAEFPLYTVDNDIQINNAGSEWSLTDDQITIVETNGDTQVLNFPYRVTVVANPDGTIDIKQNGVTIGTVPAAEPETVTTMTDVKATGDLIGTYTNEEGDEVEIKQSITSIGTITYDSTNGLLTIPHTDETGTVNNKTVTLPRPLNVLTTTQATPTPTGNTQNLNSTFKDAAGNTWIVDHEGHAILAGSAPFKELNQFHVDKNGNNTTGTGADENPFLTVQKAINTAQTADAVIVTEGTYAEALTIATPNLTLRGEGQEYGGLTEVNSIAVTANGTSVRVSALTSTGAITHSGTSPLYLSEMTVLGNFTSSTTAYTEIKDSRLQDGTISKTAAGILFIQDSLIGNATFSTANSVISMRNVTIDAGDCVTIGAGVVYNMQDVVGCVVIDAAAIPLETAILAQGGTAEQAKAAQTSNFNMIRLLDPDTEASPTKIVTWDEVTKRLEVSDLSAIAGAPSVTFGTATPPTGGTPKEGDVYFVTSTGTSTGDVTEQWIYDATSSTWVKTPSGSTAPTSTPLHQFEEANATAGQTAYTLQKTPILGSTGKVRVSRNGIDITRAWTWVGNVGTYDPAKNYGCVLDLNDNLQFEYEASEIIFVDQIAESLTTSLAAYNSAPDGSFVPVTDAEYAAIQASVTSTTKAGQVGGLDQFTTSYDFGNLGFGATATTNSTTESLGLTKAVPANNWIYAFQFKGGDAATNRTVYLQTGPKGASSGFSSILPAITGVTNTPGEMKNYILKGGVQVSSDRDIAILGGSLSAARGGQLSSFWAGNGGANSVNVNTSTFPNVWAPNQGPYIQVLTTPTKQW